jgi:phosphoribosylformylglycinamidine cyclo-ligase
LPKNTAAQIEIGSWPVLPIFEHLRELGKVSEEEMMRTFNMGIGLIIVCDQASADQLLAQLGSGATRIGRIEAGRGVRYVAT